MAQSQKGKSGQSDKMICMENKTLITEIFDTNFDPKHQMSNLDKYWIRRASRGLLIHDGKIALLNVTKFTYHKLPGGGVEANESTSDAFKRELMEEVGCDCQILDQAGITIEWRDQYKLCQISYVFLAKVVGEPGQNNLEQGEIDEGFELEWVSLENLDKTLRNDRPSNYEGNFISARDKSIVAFYKEKL